MSCKVYSNNNVHYVKFQNGKPYLYCGGGTVINPTEPTPPPEPVFNVCQTGVITSDFAITFVDNAHPLYVINDGEIGAMWGADVDYYLNNIDPNFPSCAHILFDVDTPFVARESYKGNPITEDPFYVYPTGVTNSSPIGCELPLPIGNIVEMPRPSGGTESNGSSPAIGSISQTTFKEYVIAGIETVWGNTFWTRMAASGKKLWIIRSDTVSFDYSIIEEAMVLFKSYLTSVGVTYDEYYSFCADNERYLSWVVDAITHNGVSTSCEETYQAIDIFSGTAQSSGNHPTGKLLTVSIEGLSSSTGTLNESPVSLFLANPFDTTTNYNDINWAEIVNNIMATYQEFDVANGRPDYLSSIQFLYENGIPRVISDSYCYNYTDPYTYPDYSRIISKSDVPLDKYGVPNGAVQLEYLDTFDQYQSCTPRYLNIVFTSHVNTATPPQPPAPGIDCTQFNPS